MATTPDNDSGAARFTRRAGLVGAAMLTLGALPGLAARALAQDNQIVSTKLGEVPTTGGQRPGPVGAQPAAPQQPQGVIPVSIAIGKINLNAQVEINQIVGGKMLDPTGPWVVSWYKETGKLGQVNNIVMAGHLDYWDVGPAVFYNIGQLAKGDKIDVTGDDGQTYSYSVDWNKNFDSANAPIQEIIGPTNQEDLTLITCGGPFDYQNGVYLQRTVVRSHRIAS